MGRTYTIEITPSADKYLSKLRDADLKRRLVQAIDGLALDPRPNGSKKLENSGGAWRIRVGQYRIVYDIDDKRVTVLVLDVDHRRNIYR